MSFVAAVSQSVRGMFSRPPRWLFHAVLSAAAIGLLLAFSVPGFGLPIFVVSSELLGVAAVVWLVRLVVFSRSQRTWSWWFAVAPAGGLLAFTLILANVPFNARWALSRDALQAVVTELPPGPTGADSLLVDVPSRLGAYRIRSASQVPGGVLFYEATGNGSDDAGFAYLPDGPTPALENGSFERPVFEHLGGGWYAWTASW